MDNRPLVIGVLSMHRSGSSCLMGCLEETGLHSGEVVLHAPHNVKGNRENLAIRALNDDILTFSGGSWDRPPAAMLWNEEHIERQQAISRDFIAHGTPWGFKDPRTVLTLRFWQRTMPEIRFVGSFRHPWAVVDSLVARDGMPAEQALGLWVHYNSILLAEFERSPFPLVCFDLDAGRYLEAVQRLIEQVGLKINDATGMNSFFSDELRHHAYDGRSELPLAIKVLYQRLCDATSMSGI